MFELIFDVKVKVKMFKRIQSISRSFIVLLRFWFRRLIVIFMLQMKLHVKISMIWT